jgi:DNA-binding NtrC family response regulator
MPAQVAQPFPATLAGTRTLVIEDDPQTLREIAGLLRGWDLVVDSAADGATGLDRVRSFAPQVIITDLMMPGIDGFELLSRLSADGIQTPVIVLTAFGSMEVALKIIHDLGAFWFLEKPVRSDALRVLMERAAAQSRLVHNAELLRRQLAYKGMLCDLAGSSPAMQELFSRIRQAAPTSASVLITGESGTGKELTARAIHELSPRANGPFIAINCAALPESLMESELFGHEKGAFTGALTRRAGCFELADGGTLLLDELAEMPLHLQAKLLRVLEDSRVRPLGSNAEVPVNVRIIASTNRNVEEVLKQGGLRADLFYRLNVFRIELPPLRDRIDDIPFLIDALLANLNARHGTHVPGVHPEVLAAFRSYTWPGNVRELRNVLEHAVVVAARTTITRAHLPPGFGARSSLQRAEVDSSSVKLPFGTTLAEAEKLLIGFTLARAGNDKTRAAQILGISRKTMFNRLKEYSDNPACSKAK